MKVLLDVLLSPVWFIAWLLSEMKWYRRLRGGHWEHLYLKPTGNEAWFRGAHGMASSAEITDACEDYTPAA